MFFSHLYRYRSITEVHDLSMKLPHIILLYFLFVVMKNTFLNKQTDHPLSESCSLEAVCTSPRNLFNYHTTLTLVTQTEYIVPSNTREPPLYTISSPPLYTISSPPAKQREGQKSQYSPLWETDSCEAEAATHCAVSSFSLG